jgi:hypothetical protein
LEKPLSHIEHKKSSIPLDSLHLQMATVFEELAGICKEAEDAVGEILNHPDKTTDQSLIALQGLDRLRQSLEDMARLTILLSEQNNSQENVRVPIAPIRNQLVLTGLFTRLVNQSEPTLISPTSDYDELWK